MHFVVYLLASLFLLSQTLHAREELIVIQAVSTSKQTFVINKGLKDGISKSTEALFSNKDVSLAARVVEASREHSLWQINDRRTTFPFEKNQIVTFNQESRNIWNEVPQVREKIEQAIVEAQHHQSVLGTNHSLSLKIALTNTFYESITETDSARTPKRGGWQAEGLYIYNWRRKMDIGVGLRFDQENAVIEAPNLTIPTQRILLLGEFTYHFDKIGATNNNIYATLGAGIGRSQTTVSEAVSTGLSTVLPYVKLGILGRRARGFDWLVESSLEAISSRESFIDTKEQTTNLVNAKLGVGVRF